MITAQDIREKTFERARINGYDVNSVDDFLEEVAESITAQQKEISVMTQKMKVLVGKIEEYRANEEALNLSILSAQKLAVQIENDAKERAAAIVADAENTANARLGGLDAEVNDLNRRLEIAQGDVIAFYEKIDSFLGAQSEKVRAILFKEKPAAPEAEEEPEADIEEPAYEEDITIYEEPEAEEEIEAAGEDAIAETVRSIEDSVARIQPEPTFDLDFSAIKSKPVKKEKKVDHTKVFDF